MFRLTFTSFSKKEGKIIFNDTSNVVNVQFSREDEKVWRRLKLPRRRWDRAAFVCAVRGLGYVHHSPPHTAITEYSWKRVSVIVSQCVAHGRRIRRHRRHVTEPGFVSWLTDGVSGVLGAYKSCPTCERAHRCTAVYRGSKEPNAHKIPGVQARNADFFLKNDLTRKKDESALFKVCSVACYTFPIYRAICEYNAGKNLHLLLRAIFSHLRTNQSAARQVCNSSMKTRGNRKEPSLMSKPHLVKLPSWVLSTCRMWLSMVTKKNYL